MRNLLLLIVMTFFMTFVSSSYAVSFFDCIQVTCTDKYGAGPENIVIDGEGVGWKCIDKDDEDDSCDGWQPFGGNWHEIKIKHNLDLDDDWKECGCTKRNWLINDDKKIREKDMPKPKVVKEGDKL